MPTQISIGDQHRDELARLEYLGEHYAAEAVRLEHEMRYVLSQRTALERELRDFLMRAYDLSAERLRAGFTLDTANRLITLVADDAPETTPDEPAASQTRQPRASSSDVKDARTLNRLHVLNARQAETTAEATTTTE